MNSDVERIGSRKPDDFCDGRTALWNPERFAGLSQKNNDR